MRGNCSKKETTNPKQTMTNPVIETNIERILEDHLFNEIHALDAKIEELSETITMLLARKTKLFDIAYAAGITPPEKQA